MRKGPKDQGCIGTSTAVDLSNINFIRNSIEKKSPINVSSNNLNTYCKPELENVDIRLFGKYLTPRAKNSELVKFSFRPC